MKPTKEHEIYDLEGADMEELNKEQLDQLLKEAPGGIAKLALDDMLTILYGTEAFYSVIKNVTEKVITKLPLALLRIVYSADMIHLTQQLAAQRQRKDNMISLNFRTLQQDGSFRWVMITGSKTEETYTSGNKTVPVYACIAMDITYHMVNYKKLEQSNDYHRVISELSRDLYFEYEIATDTVSFSEMFREVFGKDSVIQGFRKRLEKTKMVHQDELPAVVSIYNSMMSGRKQVRFELRLISKDGTPNWYICYAAMIFDENRNPHKVVGKLTMNNATVKEPEKQTYVPHLDSLTGVCTKESVDIMMAEAMKEQDDKSFSALFIIDIRNYKNINEIRRNINGENVLTSVGGILRKHFRSSDIIGRVGLSEFVVLMKNISSDHTVYELAERLCKEIEAIHSFNYTKSGISASIGIAFRRGEQDYQTLYANANTALVMAKKVASSSFEVFSGTVNI